MLKLTRTGIGLLTRQYRSVLHKCWLINVGLWQAMGDAVSKAVSVPARLVASLLSGGTMSGEAFSVLDEILLTRLFERKLATLTAIGLGIAAATMPTEAEASLLCYASDGTVKYTTGTTCPAGTTTKLISLESIDPAATIGNYSTALGDWAQAAGVYSTALGRSAQANGERSTALGYYNTAIGDYSLAVGSNSTASGLYALALGNQTNSVTQKTTASGEQSIAIGKGAQATGNYSTALGNYAKANGESSMALGNNAQATKDNSTALGEAAQATGESSTALGEAAQASGVSSTALGDWAQAAGVYSTALGSYAKASGQESTALGHAARATGDGSIAIGYQSVADEAYTVSVGRFGADSATIAQMKTDIDGGMTETDFEDKYAQYNAKGQAYFLYDEYKNWGTDWDDAVKWSNIAEIMHRITNVADAVNAHDAVTLGQLQNNYYRKLVKKDENLIKTANDNHKNVIVRSAKHDVTIFGRQSDNTATTTKQAA